MCGRCIPQGDIPVENRAYFYEDLAKFMFFPCKNDIYGCTVQSPWDKVLEHEICCEFEGILCPAIDCGSKIRNEELVHHFEVNHEHLILKQNKYLFSPSSMENPSYINKLLIWEHHWFIIQTNTIDEGIYFRMSDVKGDDIKTLNLKLILSSQSSPNSICLNGFKLMKYDSKCPSFSEMEKININSIKNVLGSQIACTINFDEANAQSYTANIDKLLFEVKCPVCSDYMTPPIYMCLTGHSLCETCKPKFLQCPSCSIDFDCTRNYFLEKVTEIISYPCRYKDQGCDFVGNCKDIGSHELLCPKSLQNEIRCVVNHKTCKWKGLYRDTFQHIVVSHNGHCFYPGHLVSVDLNASTMVGFFQYDKKIFKLYADWNKDSIRWAVSWIINKEKKSVKYLFCLDFVKDGRIFMISDVCSRIPATVLNQNCAHHIKIPLLLLNPFITAKRITVKLNLVKLR